MTLSKNIEQLRGAIQRDYGESPEGQALQLMVTELAGDANSFPLCRLSVVQFATMFTDPIEAERPPSYELSDLTYALFRLTEVEQRVLEVEADKRRPMRKEVH